MFGLNVVPLITSFLTHYLIQNVCYQPYGCFNCKIPFDHPLYPLPRSPDVLNTTFWLYTEPSKKPVQLQPLNDELKWFRRKKIVVIGHGFLEDITTWWIKPMVNTLLNHTDTNVIVVNWRNGARINYNQAVGNSRLVGRQVAYLLNRLFNNTKLNQSDVHLVGFSLGAHMMGYAGEWLKNKGHTIERITGLDPAGVFFEDTNEKVRLDPTDAKLVDVIHTDSKTVWVKGLGASGALGHVDFYPNGGYHQPGCKKITSNQFSRAGMYRFIACSHYRAVEYFIESVANQNAFQAFRCNDFAALQNGLHKKCDLSSDNNMGYFANKTKPGSYYLLTNNEAPFTGYHYDIQVKTGTEYFAESYATLKFRLFGTNGDSAEHNIGSHYLHTGKINSFVIHTKKNLGRLLRIEITHQGAWLKDAWLMKSVIVQCKCNQKRYSRCYRKWLSGKSVQLDLTTKQKICT